MPEGLASVVIPPAFAAVVGCAAPAGDAGPVKTERPAGPHAVLTYVGPDASMRAAYDWLYGRWLPPLGA